MTQRIKGYRAYYYGQILHGLEYNPRLFLYLLIFAAVVVYSYQFAAQVTSQWMIAAFATLGFLAGLACLVWPFQAVMLFLGLSIWLHYFVRGQTIVGFGSALVYPGDVFIGAFMMLEFFRGCMRQTHLYTPTDRWMVAFFVWAMVCVVRGVFTHGYSAVGEAREFFHVIAYFVAIHYITRPEQIRSVLKWLVAICLFTAAEQLYMIGVVNRFMPRYPGGNPLAVFAALNVVVLAVLLGRDHIKRFRFLAACALTLQIVIVLYSAQRAATASMLITLPFLAWITRRHFVKAMMMGIVALVLFINLLVFLDPMFGGGLTTGFKKAFLGMLNPAEDPTGKWRLFGWQWEMEKIFSNPFWVLIGQGFGGYYEWFFRLTDDTIRTAPHNQYVQFWSKMGVVSLAFYAAILITFYRQAFRFLHHSRNELQRSVMMIIMLVVLGCQVNQIAGGIVVGMWVVLALGTILPRLWLSEAPAPPVIRTVVPGVFGSLRDTGRWRPGSRPATSH